MPKGPPPRLRLFGVGWWGNRVPVEPRSEEVMNLHKTVLTLSLVLAASGLSVMAQTRSTNAPQQLHANMNQLMRGVLYPAANVVFSAQADNPAEVKFVPGVDPSMSTDPLTSTYGGWHALISPIVV